MNPAILAIIMKHLKITHNNHAILLRYLGWTPQNHTYIINGPIIYRIRLLLKRLFYQVFFLFTATGGGRNIHRLAVFGDRAAGDVDTLFLQHFG